METGGHQLFALGARLEACAGFVRTGKVPADIGTDHAYLPIWLVQTGREEDFFRMTVLRDFCYIAHVTLENQV